MSSDAHRRVFLPPGRSPRVYLDDEEQILGRCFLSDNREYAVVCTSQSGEVESARASDAVCAFEIPVLGPDGNTVIVLMNTKYTVQDSTRRTRLVKKITGTEFSELSGKFLECVYIHKSLQHP